VIPLLVLMPLGVALAAQSGRHVRDPFYYLYTPPLVLGPVVLLTPVLMAAWLDETDPNVLAPNCVPPPCPSVAIFLAVTARDRDLHLYRGKAGPQGAGPDTRPSRTGPTRGSEAGDD